MGREIQPQSSFADLEMCRQGVGLDPILEAISDFLDPHHELVEMVYQDLVRGLKNPTTGREGIDAQQVLRSVVLQGYKNWDLRELRERVNDSYITACASSLAFTAHRFPPSRPSIAPSRG